MSDREMTFHDRPLDARERHSCMSPEPRFPTESWALSSGFLVPYLWLAFRSR